jgi:hypothetical protein
MDGLALIVVLALAAVSVVPVDWKHDGRSALAQVRIMAAGLILLCVYMIVRGYVR